MKKTYIYILMVACLLGACGVEETASPIEERDGYSVQLVRVPVSLGDTAEAYWLVPDSVPEGGYPAVLLLHDHGAWFTIGKEKMVRPMETVDWSLKLQSHYWVNKFYEGAYIADSLAHRGYAVLVMDALYWGTRQPLNNDPHKPEKAMQTLRQTAHPSPSLIAEAEDECVRNRKAINKMLKNLQPKYGEQYMAKQGETWFETILHDDMAAVRWLEQQKEVDASSIGAAGFSMGAYRAWMLAAHDTAVAWCFAANWMTTLEAHGGPLHSASDWSMYLPELEEQDYPEIAARAADRPMQIIFGTEDPLFTPESVEEAASTIRRLEPHHQLEVKAIEAPHQFTHESLESLIRFADENDGF